MKLNFVILSLALVTYLFWLDSGCTLGGAMTYSGKVCVEDLVNKQ